MAGKSLEQRVNDADVRIRQLEARKRLLSQQLKQQERKERTRRLIQIGGIMARLGIDSLEKAHALQRVVEAQPEIQTWLRKVAALAEAGSQDAAAPSNPE
ncbi:MAG TPA: conjugal transfer protein TraD [Symbiobacteriaceae bacterium]|nr:conjugal transfer protein TraD [Symbiobacteriaceae bacterium]